MAHFTAVRLLLFIWQLEKKIGRIITDLGGQKSSEKDFRDDLRWPQDSSRTGDVVPHNVPDVVTSTGTVFQPDARKSPDSSVQLHHTFTQCINDNSCRTAVQTAVEDNQDISSSDYKCMQRLRIEGCMFYFLTSCGLSHLWQLRFLL